MSHLSVETIHSLQTLTIHFAVEYDIPILKKESDGTVKVLKRVEELGS